MAACVYTYKGTEYKSKDDLKEVLKDELVKNKSVINDKTSFILEGERDDLEFQEMVIKEEAVQQYGTSEFISSNYGDGTLEITIDANAISDLKSGEKLLFNEDTGQVESLNVAELIDKEDNGRAIPKIKNWLQEKTIFFSKKVFNEIWNAKPATETQNEPELKQKLFAFAQRLGIKVTTLEQYLKDHSFRKDIVEPDVQGLADMLTKTIAVANENDLAALTEEIAHFAIEYSIEQPIIEKMLATIHETDVYKAEAAKYRIKYGTKLSGEALEKKVRKEILGQILATKITDNFNTENAKNSAEVGIFTQLQSLWNDFINIFRKTDVNRKFFEEFGETLDRLSSQVLNLEDKAFLPWESREVYYSMDSEQQSVHDNIEKLSKRAKTNYRNVINQKGVDATERQDKANKIATELASATYGKALNTLTSMLEGDVNKAVLLISKGKQQEGSLVSNVEIPDILNAITFGKNFDIYANSIKSELANLKRLIEDGTLPEKALSKQQINSITNKVKQISKQYAIIKDDITELTTEAARKEMKAIYTKMNAKDDVVKEALRTLDKEHYKDIFWIKEFLYPLRGIANPIFNAINALMVIAENLTGIAARDFADIYSQIVVKHNLKDKAVKWLKNRNTLRNGQHTDVIEAFLEATREEYIDKIKKSKTTAEADRLTEEMDKAIDDQRKAWLIQPITDEKLSEMSDLSHSARNLVLKRSLDKKKIFDKYRLSDGTVPYQNISNSDMSALAQIEYSYKENMSPNMRDGSLKEDSELQTAIDLLRYRDKIIKDNAGVEFRDEEFKAAAKAHGITDLSDISSLTEGQKKWLSQNAVYTYSQDVLNKLDADGGALVDTEEMPPLTESMIDNILLNLHIRYKDAEGNTQTTLPNSNKYATENYQAIYDSLIAKRQALVAPYKVQGKPSEIDGISLQANEQVLDALDVISEQLKPFRLSSSSDITVVFEGNDAYNLRVKQLEGHDVELSEFKTKAKVNREGVPTAYHYKRAIVADQEKTKYPKSYQPNLKWQTSEGLDNFYNPEYNRNMAGKTVQLKLDNKQLDDKVPADVIAKLKEKHIDVKANATYRDIFIDQEFFDTFGIDQKTDFWGENGATTNKGLWDLRQFLVQEKTRVDKEYGLYNKLFQVPQTQATIKEFTDKGLLKAMRAQFGLTYLHENDDMVSGDANRVTVPKRYVNKLPHPDLLSGDISRLYGKYVEAGANYEHKNKILPKIRILEERLKNSTIGDSGGDAVNTNLYKMLNNWLSVHLYGNLVDELGGLQKTIKKSSQKLEKVAPKKLQPFIHTIGKLSPAKFAFWVYRYMRNTNLGLHAIVPMVNLINTTANTVMEHLSENQVSRDSLTWASAKVGQYYAGHVRDSGSISPKSKLMRMLRQSNLYITPEKMYDGITKKMMYRSADDILFINYRPATIATASHALFSIYDSYRLVNGEFININDFREQRRKFNKDATDKELRDEWKLHKDFSYYNFLTENDAKNTIELDKTKLEKAGYFTGLSSTKKNEKAKLLEIRLRENANRFWARTEAQATVLDRPLVFSKPIWMFVGMHSQYFFNFLTHRFASKNYNLLENKTEEGNYITIGKLFGETITDQTMSTSQKMKSLTNILMSMTTFGMYKEGLKGLEEYQQTNVKRAGVDIAMYTLTFGMFLLANAAADDDKETWWKQYLAILGTRALLEQGSQMLPTAAFDAIQRVESPVAGQRLLEGWFDILMLQPILSDGDEVIERGTYKGLTKTERDVMQLFFIKNIYSYYYKTEKYRQSNLYFRSNVISTPDYLLKKMQGKK